MRFSLPWFGGEQPRSADDSRTRTQDSARTADFARPTAGRRTTRGIATTAVVASLGLMSIFGAQVASSAHAERQATGSLIQDPNHPSDREAEPVDLNLDAAQRAAAQSSDANAQNRTDAGGLNAFNQRGTTPNRNGVRAELNRALNNANSSDRASSLRQTSDSVALEQAKSEAKKREALMDADVAKVKREAARIKEEKRKAAELLKQIQAAARQKNSATDEAAKINVSVEDLSAMAKGGVSMPLAPGTYSVGAHFGEYGSWSRWHTGQDFPAPIGTPVYAVTSGVVGGDSSASGWAGPNYITLHHANGGSTLYAHLSRRVVAPGQTVKPGQLIGYVGDLGRAFGAHLHFEYYPPGTTPGDVYSAKDPMTFLRGLGAKI